MSHKGRATGHRTEGFTLVELVVCVAISAILFAVAIPGYRSSVQKVRRADARDALLRIRVLQERHYFQHGRYAGNLPELGYPSQAALSADRHYGLEVITSGNGAAYTARATAISPEQRGDSECRTLTLNSSAIADLHCWP
jgi:type IV pilus assembly protein PilE